MQYLSELTTQASGSCGGVTASHNQHVRYLRARTIPVDPATPAQIRMRTRFAHMSICWSRLLSQAQRDEWDVYARNVTMTNALGDPSHWTGRHHFFRTNLVREFARPPALSQFRAPTIFNVSSNTPPYFTAGPAPGYVRIHFDHADAWRHELQGFLLIYEARKQIDTVTFWKGPYHFLAYIQGDPMLPPNSPIGLRPLGLHTPRDRYFFRTITTRADGRVAPEHRTYCNVIL